MDVALLIQYLNDSQNYEKSPMPRCGTTFDENSVPPWTRGDFRGVFDRGNEPTLALRDRCRCAPLLRRRDFQGGFSCRPAGQRWMKMFRPPPRFFGKVHAEPEDEDDFLHAAS
jgi:hypothetical protein